MSEVSPKVVRSYRIVFRRRWRIFRVQNWRIPLPGGLELRALGYWLACLVGIAVLGALPVIGTAVSALPSSVRLVALPVVGAWALSTWEIDGRSPHRALLGLLAWRLRAGELAGLRRCPRVGTVMPPLSRISMTPDLAAPDYPRGRISGPVRLLLRYPVEVRPEKVPRGGGMSRSERVGRARRWRLRGTGGAALHSGRTLEVPEGREVVFE